KSSKVGSSLLPEGPNKFWDYPTGAFGSPSPLIIGCGMMMNGRESRGTSGTIRLLPDYARGRRTGAGAARGVAHSRDERPRSAGFPTCCIADFPIRCPNELSNAQDGSIPCRLGSLRYSRLGNLRYEMAERTF